MLLYNWKITNKVIYKKKLYFKYFKTFLKKEITRYLSPSAHMLYHIAIKSSETREVAYTCRYTSEHLIPNSVMGTLRKSLRGHSMGYKGHFNGIHI